jgi:hypothetical protein
MSETVYVATGCDSGRNVYHTRQDCQYLDGVKFYEWTRANLKNYQLCQLCSGDINQGGGDHSYFNALCEMDADELLADESADQPMAEPEGEL